MSGVPKIKAPSRATRYAVFRTTGISSLAPMASLTEALRFARHLLRDGDTEIVIRRMTP